LLISAGTFVVAYDEVDRGKDAVALQETVLFGDKSEAEGIVIDCNTTLNYYLFWNTRFIVGETPDIHTDFTFFRIQRQEDWPETVGGVQFDVVGVNSSLNTLDVFSLGSEELSNEGRYGLAKMFLDVASRTPAGEDHKETVYLKDYYEYYPISVSLDLPGFNISERYSGIAASRGRSVI
jgi:hypothetical protein